MPVSARKITDSKDMSWSPERRAAWSIRMKKEKANGTWFKKSKKEVGEAISNGKKASNKKKKLSIARKNGWETRRANGNCDAPETNPTEKDLIRMLGLLSAIGFKLTVEEFTEQAVKEKMDRVAMVFNNGI